MLIGVFVVFGSINNAVSQRIKNMNRTEALMRQSGSLTETQVYRHHQFLLLRTIAFIFIFLFVAAGIFSGMEDWTFIQGLYFAIQTAATIGYGDMNLKAGGTNIVLGIYIMFSTTLLFFAFGHFRTLHEEFVKLKEVAKFTERKQTLVKLKELDKGEGVPMDKFVLAVLVQLGRLDQQRDIDPWIKVWLSCCIFRVFLVQIILRCKSASSYHDTVVAFPPCCNFILPSFLSIPQKFREIDTDKNGTIDSEVKIYHYM